MSMTFLVRIAHRGIDQVNAHVAALNESVGDAEAHNQRIVKLELFGEPANVELQRNAEAERNIRAREDTLHERR